jgi:ketosteroid isomerase-like protein
MTAPTISGTESAALPAGTGARNAATLAEGYAAFGRGDLVALSTLFSPEAVWHVRRLGQLSGDHAGFDAILAFFGRSAALTQGTFRVAPIEILANDQGAAAVVRSQATRDGNELDSRQIQHFHMADGIVTEVWQYVSDPDTTDRFWA